MPPSLTDRFGHKIKTAQELRDILVATGTSDARLEEGSMRVDANVSVRPVGSDELRTRCEIKNLNSFRSLGRAIEYEAARHVSLWESGEEPRQETRHWSEDDGRTHSMRSKEEADDYRYFTEPDLVPLVPDPEWVEEMRAALPPMPAARRAVVRDATGADGEAAAVIVSRDMDDLVVAAAAAGADGTRLVTHAVNNLAEGSGQLTAESFAALVAMETGGELTATQAKTVLGDLVESGGDPATIAASHGFEAMDTSELETLVDEAIAADPEAWATFCDGEDRVQGAFVGYVMKATRGQADGKAVSALLRAKRG